MRPMGNRAATDPRRRSALLIVMAVALAATVAFVLSALSTPHYRTSAEVMVDAGAAGAELLVASSSQLVADVRAVVGDEPELSVAAVGDVLQFTATSTNAENAATAANVHADVYADQAPGAEVFDRADVPSDSYEPDVVRSVVLAALAGLVIGVVAALLVAWRDGTVRSERQLTKNTGMANLAVIPRHPLGEVRPDDVAVIRDPNSIESEAYRTLRTVLDFVAQDRPFTVLLVTSPRPGEGKSSVAANLAAAVAQLGRKVVLVDGDLRRPQVHRLFGTGNEFGLSSVLTGDAPLQRCVQRVDPDRKVALLTAGTPPPDPAELLAHERLRLAIESLAGASDLVVIDAPPVLPVADPIILAQVADATLLVATAGLSDRREWTETLDRLAKVDAAVIGTVLLRPDARIHATPSYRYAPSAAPAHWWVTEASRRSGSTPTAAGAEAVDPAPPLEATEGVHLDRVIVDEPTGAPVVDRPADEDVTPTCSEPATAETYPWARRVESGDEMLWHDSASAPDVDAGADGVPAGDGEGQSGDGDEGDADAEPVTGEAPAG
jgi:capsular exopolysaccharide synthesis family protein